MNEAAAAGAGPAAAGAKTATSEEFPVASRLLEARLRPAVMAFYRFVRTADDIADAPGLAADEKLRRLATLEAGLDGAAEQPLAAALVAVDRTHGAGVAEARRMLGAFRQDAGQHRYRDWDELLAYCDRSAVPVGRFLLRLHGEGRAAEAAADALCTALQLLNHLQDLAVDRDRLGRAYLPAPWLDVADGEAAFFAPEAADRRRPLLDAALDQVDALLDIATALPADLRSRRLARQAAATVACGRALARHLRRHDPIRQRVTLGRLGAGLRVAVALTGIGAAARSDRALTRRITDRSGSSFRLGIRCLQGERRRALEAVYAYCRNVDDVADGAAPAAERRRFLERWRDELDRLERPDDGPRTPVGRELAVACARFALPPAELRLLLEGMIVDAADRVRLADEAAFEDYCRAVAGSVGILSVRIFGAVGADPFALALARALQSVNVLRDVDEDARRDRVYLPRSRLAALGIPDGDARTMVAYPAFARAWEALAAEAEAAFARAERLAAGLDPRPLRPALVMLWSYRPLLDRLRRRGWQPQAPRLRLGRTERLRLVARALAAPS